MATAAGAFLPAAPGHPLYLCCEHDFFVPEQFLIYNFFHIIY